MNAFEKTAARQILTRSFTERLLKLAAPDAILDGLGLGADGKGGVMLMGTKVPKTEVQPKALARRQSMALMKPGMSAKKKAALLALLGSGLIGTGTALAVRGRKAAKAKARMKKLMIGGGAAGAAGLGGLAALGLSK